MQGMSLAVRSKGRNYDAGRAKRQFCLSQAQLFMFWDGGGKCPAVITGWTPTAGHRTISSSATTTNGSSINSINGDNNFVYFYGELHEGVEFYKGGADVKCLTAHWACSLNT